MAALTTNIDIGWKKRLCRVNGKYGYFHVWGGSFSCVYGIVEFDDGVRRVDPTHIEFCDKDNAILYNYNEHDKENKDE